MNDYRVDAATKTEWAERAMRAEDEVAYLKSEIKYLRRRIMELERQVDGA